ncbi:MAG: hypothetical protein HY714_05770 [Candidatus Omnitrophica bacterium]|nr:hypothetical protein [Candidatus Omnitrophota bacterium]
MKTLLFVLCWLIAAPAAWAANELLVGDFNAGEPPNNVGGAYGTWNHDPNDDTQGCFYFHEPEDSQQNPDGFAIRLDYDVQSKNPAFNGFWIKLAGIDTSEFNVLSFWVRGGADGKFTTRFKVEVKDDQGHRAIYPVQGITAEWQEIRIEIKKTKSELNWKKMTEMVVVFDDIVATYKEGTIYIDQISFKK